MPEANLLNLFVMPLTAAKLDYFVSGSVASMLYGEPRVTHDVDLVINFKPADISSLSSCFPRDEYYVPPEEILLVELSRERRGHFNVLHVDSGFKADFYIADKDPLYPWAFKKIRNYEFKGKVVRLAPPEYVIIKKLEYFREGGSEKHLKDIKSMILSSGDLINREELEEWLQQRGLAKEWLEAQKY